MDTAETSLFGPDFRAAQAGHICSPGVEIRADSSEKASGVPALLSELGASVVSGPLAAGDYLVCGRTLVERKTVQDFAQSLYGGRLFEQMSRLKKASGETLLAIEGGKWFFSEVKPKAVRMAFLSALVFWKVPAIFTRDPAETAALLAELGEKNLGRSNAICLPGLFHRNKTKSLYSIERARLRVLSEIPGVGPKIAAKLMARFGTVRGLAEASEEDIASVYGVGGQKAARILWALRESAVPYTPPGI